MWQNGTFQESIADIGILLSPSPPISKQMYTRAVKVGAKLLLFLSLTSQCAEEKSTERS